MNAQDQAYSSFFNLNLFVIIKRTIYNLNDNQKFSSLKKNDLLIR